MVSRRSRAGALGVVWRVLREGRRPGAPGLGARLAAVPRLVRATLVGRYPGMSRGRVLALAIAAVYVVFPVDVVPEAFLGPLGLVDDVAVAAWLAGTLLVESDRYLEWERSSPRVVRGTVVR